VQGRIVGRLEGFYSLTCRANPATLLRGQVISRPRRRSTLTDGRPEEFDDSSSLSLGKMLTGHG